MRVVCISDTHGMHSRVAVPDGDLLIHAGDITSRGELSIVEQFNEWLGRLPHQHKVVIAGNHDYCFERNRQDAEARLTNCTYLQDSETTVEGFRIWGSPWQPWFFDWAFNLRRGDEISRKWDLIPAGIDILVTHGPPRGYGDITMREGEEAGCENLMAAIKRVRPRLHVYGHIHEGYGLREADGTTFINASICTLQYHPTNAPIVIDL